MSTMSTTQKKRDWAPVIRMSMAIVVTAAIYFPLFLVQTVETPLPAATEWNDEIKVVALPPYAELQRWDRLGKSLYRWTDIGNPTLLILPNNELGFSRFRPGSPPRDAPPPPVSWQQRNSRHRHNPSPDDYAATSRTNHGRGMARDTASTSRCSAPPARRRRFLARSRGRAITDPPFPTLTCNRPPDSLNR